MLRARYIIPLVVFVVIAAFMAVGLTRDPSRVPSPLIGEPVPSFELATVTDPERSVSPGDFEGRVWLLNVWASWCAACREEHPVMMRAARREGLTLIGLDYKDERASAIEWLERHGDPYTVSAHDPEGRVGLDLGVYGVPETYVIDAAGVIRYKHIGPISHEILEQEILPLVDDLQRSP